jgi:hypothetical protein
MIGRGRWRIGLSLVLLATLVRLCWAVVVPTIPVGDFATYRESGMYLAEFGRLDHGFVYMPGLVLLLAAVHSLGGDVLAGKVLVATIGGLATGPLYVLVSRLIDNGRGREPGQPPEPPRQAAPYARGAPVALAAGLGYALWPAGIAMSSVIGTDIPTAAMMLMALAFLTVWGPTRPRLAAGSFGVAMGLAAYFRAVALPLTALSAGYWILRRVGLRAVVTRTAIAVALTVVLLLPWGVRNLRRGGEFYLTDSHGGITALMGNYPNTEGTYARSLGILFQELTGRTFLMEPHRQTDRAAYAIAKQWIVFDPLWTLGMIAVRAERLFAPEHGLLYWSIYRRGVLPPPTAAWFNQYRRLIVGVTDGFYLLFVLGLAAGLAFAVAERRWLVLVPLPFALALVATYALFVAEPRYRLTSEVLLFPLAAFGAVRLWQSGVRAVRSLAVIASRPAPGAEPGRWTAGSPAGSAAKSVAKSVGGSSGRSAGSDDFALTTVERRGLLGTVAVLFTLAVTIVIVIRGGAALRDRHRWAATVWHVDGRPQLALWRPRASLAGPSPVRGTPTGAAVTLAGARHEAEAEIVLPNLTMPRGPIQIRTVITWVGQPSTGTLATIGGASAPAGANGADGWFAHPGGPVVLAARVDSPTDAGGSVSVLFESVTLTTETPPPARP